MITDMYRKEKTFGRGVGPLPLVDNVAVSVSLDELDHLVSTDDDATKGASIEEISGDGRRTIRGFSLVHREENAVGYGARP